MSVTILFILFLLLLTGKPRFRKHLPLDGSYLSHERTNLINAFFIIIIVLRHIHQRIIPFEGIDLFYAHAYEHKAAQSIVSSFFVFSGYGIMMSLLKKKESYLKELMSKRFVKLYFNMAVCAFVSAITYIFTYTTWELALHHAVLTCLGLGGYWFIIMTLVIYITTWLSFTVIGLKRPAISIILSGLLIYGVCVALIPVKPAWWLDTELCFPCGMLLALYRPKIDSILTRTKLPILFVGIGVTILGWRLMKYCPRVCGATLYHAGIINDYSMQVMYQFFYPLCTVVFVLGIAWTFASFTWKKFSPFLVWLGGPAVFYIFVLHFIAIRAMQALGWHAYYPQLCILLVVLATLALAYTGYKLLPKLDKLVFDRHH